VPDRHLIAQHGLELDVGQTSAVSVWAWVRTVDVAEPSAFTSWKSRVQRAEVSFGGAGGANRVGLRTSSDVTKPSQGSIIGANMGGVGRQTPGPGR
jgi:hypothetical protein